MCLLFLPTFPCLRRYFHSNKQFINTVTNRRRNLHVCYCFPFLYYSFSSYGIDPGLGILHWFFTLSRRLHDVWEFSQPVYMMCFMFWNIHINPCSVQWKMLSGYGVFGIEPFVKCYSDHVLFRLYSEHLVISQTCFWTSPKLHFVTSSAHNFYEDRIWRHSQRSEDGARKLSAHFWLDWVISSNSYLNSVQHQLKRQEWELAPSSLRPWFSAEKGEVKK